MICGQSIHIANKEARGFGGNPVYWDSAPAEHKRNELIYPISYEYVKDWGEWEIVRELVSNALDADPNCEFGIDEEGAFYVRDHGDGLAIRQLLLGISEKRTENAIGQFGEGLKMALLVLTRMGMRAEIWSNNLHLWNEEAEIDGVKVFKAVWEVLPEDEVVSETLIRIPDWQGGDFRNRFIRQDDPRIIGRDSSGRFILDEENPQIYVRGVWVCDAGKVTENKGYAFGYNLMDAEMNRDRGVVSAWVVSGEIGRIWGSIEDPALLEKFWKAVKEGYGERNASLSQNLVKNPEVMKESFQKVFGPNAVVKTDRAMAREAEYRGAEVIDDGVIGYGMKDYVAKTMGSDASYVMEDARKTAIPVSSRRLDSRQKKTLSLIKKLARRYGYDPKKIRPYILPPGKFGQESGGEIRIGVDVLDNELAAVKTFLHEAAHAEFKTDDATAQHVEAISHVAAQIILGYASHEW